MFEYNALFAGVSAVSNGMTQTNYIWTVVFKYTLYHGTGSLLVKKQ